MRHTSPTHIHRFGNGLTLLVREEKSHPVASLQFWVQTGSINEGGRLGSGLSHLLEHMVFKGTRNMSGQELARTVQQQGGLWNAYTSTGRTVYYIEGPSASWESFLGILTELVFHPSFPFDEFEKEKEVIRREMDMYDDDPDSVAYKLLMQTLYKKHPRRYPVLGEIDSFNLVSHDDMCAYHRDRYCPNNVFVVVAGDVDAGQVIEFIGRQTGDLLPGALLAPPIARESHQWGRRVAREEFPLPYSKLTLAWRVPEQEHPDSPALTLLSRVLGAGRSARLYRKFHDELGLVHSVTASVNQSSGEEGVFLISADVDRDKRDHVRDLILEELASLAREDLSADLARGIKRAKASRIKGMATVSGVADDMAGQWFHYRNTDYFCEWLEALERVTGDDVKCCISRWLNAICMTEVSLDPQGSNGAEDECPEHSGDTDLALHVLPNGLQVVLRNDKRLPMVYGCLAFKGGSPFETPETAGVTSLLAECMLKGTRTRSGDEIATALENLGGVIDSSSGNNSMNIGFNVLAEDIETGLELLGDVVLNPVFPEDAFEHERLAMISDAREQLEDPVSVAFLNFKHQAYGDVSYGLPPEGTVESLTVMTQHQMLEHYRRLVCGRNAVLCLAGDFDEQDILPMIEKYLGRMPEGEEPGFSAAPEQRSGECTAILDKEQAVLVLGMPGVDVRSDRREHAALLHAWCSDMAGPIFTGIREDAGLAYFASSSLFMGLDTGNILFYLGTSMAQLDEARAKLIEILEQIHRDGMSPGDLERTRASALSALMLARQSNGTLSQRLALDVLFGLPADHVERQEEIVNAVTLDEMNAFIGEYLSSARPRVWSIVRNAE